MSAQATPGRTSPNTEHVDALCPESPTPNPTRKADRRVERTKRSLLEAFFSLMIEKGYDACGVADIVQRANVGRSTFYAHYADKEDLLQDSLRGLKQHLLDASAQLDPRAESVHPALLFSLPMLEHILDARALFTALASKGTGAVVQKELHLMLSELVLERLQTSEVSLPGPPALVAEFVVGAFLAVCFWWMNGREELSPKEIDRVFQRLAMPGLSSSHGLARGRLREELDEEG